MKTFHVLLLFMLPWSSGYAADSLKTTTPKRMLVVSGGGALGAWGVGLIRRLDSIQGPYSQVVGTSTGALMAPFILLREFDSLHEAYTSVTQDSIFNVNPFKANGQPRLGNAFFRFLLRKPTLGETKPLRRLVRRFLPNSALTQLANSPDLDFIVAVTNLRTLEVEFKSARALHFQPETMRNWIWASANEPVFMTLFNTETTPKNYYVDGGLRANVPVEEALDRVFKDTTFHSVDIIINHPPEMNEPKAFWPGTESSAKKPRILSSLLRSLDALKLGIREMNLTLAKRIAELHQQSDVATRHQSGEGTAEALGAVHPPIDTSPPGAQDKISLHFYFMPDSLAKLIPNELIFEPGPMKILYEAGLKGKFLPPIDDADHPTLAPQKDLEQSTRITVEMTRGRLGEILSKEKRQTKP